jgi:hypothetical protein
MDGTTAGPTKGEDMPTISTTASSCRRFLLLTALASALTTAVVLVPRPAQAVNGIGRTCYYYSDASHTHQVGKNGYDCCGRRFSQGIITQYSVCNSVFCGAGGCPNPPQ